MLLKKLLLGGSLLIAVLVLAGCDYNANNKEAQQVNQQQQVYMNGQPTPAFDWSLERHIMIELYKARNQAVNTYSYVRNYQGQIVFSCKSIGFPLPANDQLTNSMALANPGNNTVPYYSATALPQVEPNGLYSSPSTSGTYVFCLNSDGTVSPSYFEADVETHLAPLKADGSGLASDSELKINTKK